MGKHPSQFICRWWTIDWPRFEKCIRRFKRIKRVANSEALFIKWIDFRKYEQLFSITHNSRNTSKDQKRTDVKFHKLKVFIFEQKVYIYKFQWKTHTFSIKWIYSTLIYTLKPNHHFYYAHPLGYASLNDAVNKGMVSVLVLLFPVRCNYLSVQNFNMWIGCTGSEETYHFRHLLNFITLIRMNMNKYLTMLCTLQFIYFELTGPK